MENIQMKGFIQKEEVSQYLGLETNRLTNKILRINNKPYNKWKQEI